MSPSFQRLATHLPVDEINMALSAQADLWDAIPDRQRSLGSAHHDTKTIFLRWCVGRDRHSAFHDLTAVPYASGASVWPVAEPLVETTKSLGNGVELGRVILTMLRPMGVIDLHADEGAYADYYERFHVVIQSDEGNVFVAGRESVWMHPGEVWWFNHKEPHYVVNGSDRERIHLIIDMTAPLYRRERPQTMPVMAGGTV